MESFWYVITLPITIPFMTIQLILMELGLYKPKPDPIDPATLIPPYEISQKDWDEASSLFPDDYLRGSAMIAWNQNEDRIRNLDPFVRLIGLHSCKTLVEFLLLHETVIKPYMRNAGNTFALRPYFPVVDHDERYDFGPRRSGHPMLMRDNQWGSRTQW